jgi:ubiquinone biosynthesis protein
MPYLRKFFGIAQKTPMRFEREVNFVLDKYSSLPIRKINLGNILQDVLKIARRLRLRVDPEIGILGKTLWSLESICVFLDPSVNLLELSQAYWQPLLKKGVLQHFWLEDLKSVLTDYRDMIKHFPKEWESFLVTSEERVELEQQMLERLGRYERSMDNAGTRISMGILLLPVVAAALILGVKSLSPKFFVLCAAVFVLFVLVIFKFLARKDNE